MTDLGRWFGSHPTGGTGVPAELQDLPGWAPGSPWLSPSGPAAHPVSSCSACHIQLLQKCTGDGHHGQPQPAAVRSLCRGLQGDGPKCHLLLANNIFYLCFVLFCSTKSLKVKISVGCWTSENLCTTPMSLWMFFVSPSHLLICICSRTTFGMTH